MSYIDNMGVLKPCGKPCGKSVICLLINILAHHNLWKTGRMAGWKIGRVHKIL